MPCRSLPFSFFLSSFLFLFFFFHLLLRPSLSPRSFLSRPVHLSADVIVPSLARGLGAPVSGLLSLLSLPRSPASPLQPDPARLSTPPPHWTSHLITASPRCRVGKCSGSIALQQSEDSTKKTAHRPLQDTTINVISIVMKTMSAAQRRYRPARNDSDAIEGETAITSSSSDFLSLLPASRCHCDLRDSDPFVRGSMDQMNNGSIFFPLSAALSSNPSEKTLV